MPAQTTLALFLLLLPAVSRAEFKNESELGIVSASGNSRTQSLNLKQHNSYSWEKNTIGLRGSFLQSKSRGVIDAKRWDAELRYERAVSDRLSFFVSQGVEADRFAGFMQRYNTGVGPKYVIYREPKVWEWFAELGYRYSRERLVDESHISKNQVRVYTEVNREWKEGITSRYWIEYLPNFTNSKDWELRSELSSSAALNTVFSVKVAYLVKYDSLPVGGATSKSDRLFTTSLVAKY